MNEKEWFENWFNSYFYYQLYADRDKTEATNFIKNLLTNLSIAEDSKILDVACGRGRYSRIMNEMGYNVFGIDIAVESIAYANQHANEKLHFFVHDMRLPFWINYFDFAFNFFTSFGYFKTQREDDAAIRTMSQSLKYGGTLVLDYLNPAYTANHLVAHEEKIIKGTIYKINRYQDEKKFHKQITVYHPSLEKPLTYTEVVSKFSLHDFEVMFAKQHLRIHKVYGNYSLAEYDQQTSPRLIMIATKER